MFWRVLMTWWCVVVVVVVMGPQPNNPGYGTPDSCYVQMTLHNTPFLSINDLVLEQKKLYETDQVKCTRQSEEDQLKYFQKRMDTMLKQYEEKENKYQTNS